MESIDVDLIDFTYRFYLFRVSIHTIYSIDIYHLQYRYIPYECGEISYQAWKNEIVSLKTT